MKKFIYLVLMILALILAIALGWWWREMSPKNRVEESKVERTYQLLDPMRAILPQEDFVVVFRPLRLELEKLAQVWAEKGVVVSVQIEYLNTGTHLSINQNYRMLPASLTKVPVAMMVMHQVENETLKLDQEIELLEEDRDSKWGELYKAPSGTKLPLEEVLRKSLVESDNTAHKMLYRLVGVDDAQALSQELNLEDLFDESGKITAREYARLLRSLYTSSYLTAQNSQLILDHMTRDQVVKFLIRGLGENTPYAHKFGESAAIRSYLDAGIVYVPNRPFIIVVMVQDVEGRVGLSREVAGEEIFEVIAKKTYDYVVDQSR